KFGCVELRELFGGELRQAEVALRTRGILFRMNGFEEGVIYRAGGTEYEISHCGLTGVVKQRGSRCDVDAEHVQRGIREASVQARNREVHHHIGLVRQSSRRNGPIKFAGRGEIEGEMIAMLHGWRGAPDRYDFRLESIAPRESASDETV